MKRALLFLGPQGSGKGTQAHRLAGRLGWPIIEGGKLLRELAAGESVEAKKAKTQMEAGELVDRETAMRVFDAALAAQAETPGLILDGFGRQIDEFHHEQKVLAARGYIPRGVLLEISDEEAVARLTKRWICDGCYQPIPPGADPQAFCARCGGKPSRRPDDEEQPIRERLAQYHALTMPVVSQLESKGSLYRIVATGTIEEVAERVLKAVQPLLHEQ